MAMVIYRVKNKTTGEIKESTNFKRLFGIMVSELREEIGKSGYGDYKGESRIIEKVIYDCSEDTDDYYHYPIIDSENVALVFVSTIALAYYRCSDEKEIVRCRV